MPSAITVLLPAQNEETSIGPAIQSLLQQTLEPTAIVVIANGCTDKTAEIARSYPVTVMELPRLRHGKAEALNRAWIEHASEADIVVCADSDALLPPHALEVWTALFDSNNQLGATSAAIRVQGDTQLAAYQRGLFSLSDLVSARTREALVLFGAGCAVRGRALHEVVDYTRQEGPWDYFTQGEDFQLTCTLRRLGYKCIQTPEVIVTTGPAPTLQAFWLQSRRWDVAAFRVLTAHGWDRGSAHGWLNWWGPLLLTSGLRYLLTLGALVMAGRRKAKPAILSAVTLAGLIATLDIVLPRRAADTSNTRRETANLGATTVLLGYMKAGEALLSALQVALESLSGNRSNLWKR